MHGGEATHAAVLFVELAINLHQRPWGFRTAGEQATANDCLG